MAKVVRVKVSQPKKAKASVARKTGPMKTVKATAKKPTFAKPSKTTRVKVKR